MSQLRYEPKQKIDGWDVFVPQPGGKETTRIIVRTSEGFTLVNPFKWPDTSLKFASFEEALEAAGKLLV
ncbi:MAG TPA: hypothetical protein VFM18_18435 [Methanosarcina sp.]|nr:hypothetical protein [Methanosarcina sp.]